MPTQQQQTEHGVVEEVITANMFIDAFRRREVAKFVWKPKAFTHVRTNGKLNDSDVNAERDFVRANGYGGYDMAFIRQWPSNARQAAIVEALIKQLQVRGCSLRNPGACLATGNSTSRSQL